MSARRGRRAAASHEGGHDGPDERWAVSYSDMVTVLMCLFIVLFAMSSIDKGKYDQLKESLATGFGREVSEETDKSDGIIVPEELLEEDGTGFMAAAVAEYEDMTDLLERVKRALAKQGLENAATFTIDERGLTIGLVSSETFFATNSTDLSGKARQVLRAVSGVLATDSHEISIEGHADYRAPVYPYPTNWELSSARATGVLRYFVEGGSVSPGRIKAVGYGSARPIAEGRSPAELAKNRRVDIVVLSAVSEQARELLPEVDKAAKEESSAASH